MIDLDFEGLDNLIKQVEKISTDAEIKKTTKKVLKECGDLAFETVKPMVHKSKDHSKSGPQHKGSPRLVPPGHARDNIPKPRIKSKNGNMYVVVGWEKSDNEDYFYMKFEEWGTSKRPPHTTFGKVNKMLRNEYEEIALKEFNEMLEEVEGE